MKLRDMKVKEEMIQDIMSNTKFLEEELSFITDNLNAIKEQEQNLNILDKGELKTLGDSLFGLLITTEEVSLTLRHRLIEAELYAYVNIGDSKHKVKGMK